MIRVAQMHSVKYVNTIYLLVTKGNSTFTVEKSVDTILRKSSKLILPEIKHSDIFFWNTLKMAQHNFYGILPQNEQIQANNQKT